MPIFVAAGAAAAYSYYKKRSSGLEEGAQAEAEEGKCSCSTSCDCGRKASANDDPSSDASSASGEANKALTNAGAGAPVPEKENDRPVPTLLEEWNKKYGANRGGRTGTSGSKISSVEGGETLSRSTSVPVAENSATCTCSGSDTDDNVAIAASVPAETIGVDDKETYKNADAAGNATLLQTWNDRYPHLAKKGKQRRQRFDGPAGKMVRSFLAKRNAGPSPTSTGVENDKNQKPKVETNTTEDAESSEVEKEQKTDLCESEQNENATLDPSRGCEKDSSIEGAPFGTDALYQEVASAIFGGELSNR